MNTRRSLWCRSALLASSTLVALVGVPLVSAGQDLEDLKTANTPLVLKAQGSFFVGGEKSDQTEVELGSVAPRGHVAVNQMYVRYMVPQDGAGNVPVVMVHGITLTGKTWETTPESRMGSPFAGFCPS